MARDQLASTIDSLAVRANPRRLADDIKVRVIEFVKKPAVAASLVGVGALTVIIVVRRVRNRCPDGVHHTWPTSALVTCTGRSSAQG